MSMASKVKIALPSDLEDDQKAAVLYSPFREKSLNPQSWNRKMKFWEKLLSVTALERNIVTFDISSLPSMFERKGMAPKCLETVAEELRRSGTIKPVSYYQRADGWLTWGFNVLIKQPVSWGVSRLFSSNKDSNVFVWPQVVKKLCETIVNQHQSTVEHDLTDNLMSLASFRILSQTLIPDERDFEIVILQLERDKKLAITVNHHGEKVVKFCKKGDSYVSPISDLELQIYQIQEMQRRLEKEIESLSQRAKGHETEARTYIREDKKIMAKHCLRKKKALLRTIERKSGSLNILHDNLQKIEEAGTNEKVIKAIQAGTEALKALNSELSLEKTEAVMDDMQEAIENQDEISQAMGSMRIDDEDYEKDLDILLNESLQNEEIDTSVPLEEEKRLERELDVLLSDTKGNEQEDKKRRHHELLDLPSVPSHLPSSSGEKERKPATSSQPLPSS